MSLGIPSSAPSEQKTLQDKILNPEFIISREQIESCKKEENFSDMHPAGIANLKRYAEFFESAPVGYSRVAHHGVPGSANGSVFHVMFKMENGGIGYFNVLIDPMRKSKISPDIVEYVETHNCSYEDAVIQKCRELGLTIDFSGQAEALYFLFYSKRLQARGNS